MKIQIDTDARTITLEEEVKLGEFFRIMEQLMPNGEWEHFKLKTSTIVVNQNTQPIIIERYQPVPEIIGTPVTQPQYPWYTTSDGTSEEVLANTTTHTVLNAGPNDITNASNSEVTLTSGIFTVDYKY